MGSAPHPAAPMSLAEARRIVTDHDFGGQFCPNTRASAWQQLLAHRRGDRVVVVVLRTSLHPTTPGDAA